MTERPESARLFSKALKLAPGGVHSPVRAFRSVGGDPVFFRSGKGGRFIDADGREYVDFCLSWGPLILGHAEPTVVAAVKTAAESGLSFGACHEGEIRLAEMILEAFPEYERVRFMSSGTEAVMTAIRLARGVTGRPRIIKFDGGYHGHSDSLLVKAGSGLATFGTSSSKGVTAAVAEQTVVLPLDDETAVEEAFRLHGAEIACIIIEPLPGNNGLLEQRPEFLRFLREISTRHGALLIFDEVISGLRLKYGGYGQMVGVQADLTTLGKIIGGGMPVGAVVGSRAIMERLAPVGDVYQAGTLSGNPVAMAAGVAALSRLRNPMEYAKLEKLGATLDGVWTKAQQELPYLQWRRVGSLIWPYLAEGPVPRRSSDIRPEAVERFNRIYHKVLDRNFYMPPSAYELLMLCTAHDEKDVGDFATCFADMLKSQAG